MTELEAINRCQKGDITGLNVMYEMHRTKVFNQAGLARMLDVSQSTVARIVEPLVKSKIILFEKYEGGMKIFALNQEGPATRALIDFYDRLQNL